MGADTVGAKAATRPGRLHILGQRPPIKERKDAARNRVRILEATRQLLRDRPIQDICMDEVARTAGVGKGTLYRRFEDRATLCRALLNDEATKLQNRVLDGFGAPLGPPWLDQVARLLDALFDFVVDNASLLSEALAFERGRPGRFDHPAQQWQRTALAIYLQRAVDGGELPALDTAVTAELILAPLDPDLIRHTLARGVSREHLQAVFRRQWRFGVNSS